jgi:uncharacterized protein YbbC (DUF1343 family)
MQVTDNRIDRKDTTERVYTGPEVLAEEGFARLKGRRVGLVTNPTGILPDRTSTIESLMRADGVQLRALFGPEHGVRGDVPAGKYVPSSRDARTGLPVYSLYGRTKVPTAAMLRGLDTLVFDIQDIGARSYTYLSTLGSVMDGAARHGVAVVVLDRPNPVGLDRVEGGPTRPGFTSFVSKYPVGYLHGMTLGEVARMINGRGWLLGGRKCDLTVVPCRNLTRTMATWGAFGAGLPWVPTSPNVPRATTPHFYAATGITGELPTLSIGIGTTQQFELAGAPGIDSAALARELDRRSAVLTGWEFRPATWTPTKGAHKGRTCGGVRLVLSAPERAPLTRINFEILDALRTLDRTHDWFGSDAEATRLFDLSCGTDRVRKAFRSGAGASDLWGVFNEGHDAFLAARRPYLLYT